MNSIKAFETFLDHMKKMDERYTEYEVWQTGVQWAENERWQPINTAPKDGTGFIAFVPESKWMQARVIMCCWNRGDKLNPPNWNEGCLPCFPTHWMPKPKHPEIK